MRVLVCGDRAYAHRARVYATLDALGSVETVIEGTATGADTFGGEWADLHGVEHLRFPALWDRYGRAAGPVRNRQMLEEGKPDLVVAFHHDLSQSKGTADMVRQARKAGVPVEVVT